MSSRAVSKTKWLLTKGGENTLLQKVPVQWGEYCLPRHSQDKPCDCNLEISQLVVGIVDSFRDGKTTLIHSQYSKHLSLGKTHWDIHWVLLVWFWKNWTAPRIWHCNSSITHLSRQGLRVRLWPEARPDRPQTAAFHTKNRSLDWPFALVGEPNPFLFQLLNEFSSTF